jgi:hypothetical protein
MGLYPHVVSPSGGYHYYVSYPGHHVPTLNGKSKTDLGRRYPGMDVKGDGGYVIFSGVMEQGEYFWLGDPVPDAPNSIPDDVWRFLQGEPALASAIVRTPRFAVVREHPSLGPASDCLLRLAVNKVLAGTGRNDAGFWLATQLRDARFNEADAADVMLTYVNQVPNTNTKGQYEAYTVGEALASLRSAFTRPPREPLRACSQTGQAGILDSRFSITNNNLVIENTASSWLKPLDALLLSPDMETLWTVDELLPEGGSSILASKPKVGKSTLLRALAYSVARGEMFLGRTTRQGPVIYLALEEKDSEVKRHFKQMGATDENILIRTAPVGEHGFERLKEAVQALAPSLVIIDPLLKFVRIQNVNDYAEVTAALQPITDFMRTTTGHVILAHHMGKAERIGADGILGSVALFGGVDTAILLDRSGPTRVISSEQRYGSNMKRAVLILNDETGRVSINGVDVVTRVDNSYDAKVLREVGSERLTEPEIKERVGGDQTETALAIRRQCVVGALIKTGRGVRGDPYRYERAASLDPPIIRAVA